jgi:hypothetical protein
MTQYYGLIIFILIFVGVIVALLFSNRQRDEISKHLAEISLQKGWKFQNKPSAYVDCIIRGQESDFRWELSYINKERSQYNLKNESVESIVWFSPDVTTSNGSIVLYPKLGNIPNSPQLANPEGFNNLARGLLNTILQASGIDASNSSPQEVGSPPFQSKYMVMAPDAPSAQRLVSAVQVFLLDWPVTGDNLKLPSIIIDPKGITVRVVRNGLPINFQYQIAETVVSLGIDAANGVR